MALLNKLSAAAIILAATAVVPACSSPSSLQALYALDSTYAAAATAEANYAKSSIADPAVVAQMKDYDNKAYAALAPLTTAASQPGATVDSVALAAAEAAVTQFASFATSHTVKS